MCHQSSGGAPAGLVVRVSYFRMCAGSSCSSAFGPVVLRGRVASLGVGTASRSTYRSRAPVAIVKNDVAGLNLSPRAPTGGLGLTHATRFRIRHLPAGDGSPVRRLRP